ncbi:glyoxylate/hydroxypyruvate reductase A [Roseibium sp. MMSF_3412]|uniref:2-hydroxyacid dehydrogenase n=1 Tax=Roseibium sp. MMSF_3412 TaxID=3046712 RepID=UPI00273FBA93|nr:glyoxylate/hydroxypyruvate reductase A [Roseibium sp. MMSF_3412]
MKPVVPFIPEAQSHERNVWQRELSRSLSDLAELKPFETLTEEERLAARVAIVANPDPAHVAALPNLVWVQSLWAGVERLMSELPEGGPLIVRLADPQMAETMSEAVLAWTLYLHRDMPRYMLQQRQGIWQEHFLKTPAERTVGVLGLGNLGNASAQRLKANGFTVTGWSRSEKTLDGVRCFHGPDGLKQLLGEADIVVVLVPLTDETRGLLGEDEFKVCKQDAAIINFARGPVIETGALVGALDAGHLSHAVLDVFDQEPLPSDNPLWHHEKVTVLPHISAPTIISTASRLVARNLKAFLESDTIPDHVDRKRGY